MYMRIYLHEFRYFRHLNLFSVLPLIYIATSRFTQWDRTCITWIIHISSLCPNLLGSINTEGTRICQQGLGLSSAMATAWPSGPTWRERGKVTPPMLALGRCAMRDIETVKMPKMIQGWFSVASGSGIKCYISILHYKSQCKANKINTVLMTDCRPT